MPISITPGMSASDASGVSFSDGGAPVSLPAATPGSIKITPGMSAEAKYAQYEEEQKPSAIPQFLQPSVGALENIANQVGQFGTMAAGLVPNAVGSIGGELVDSLVNQRLPTIDNIAQRMQTGSELMNTAVYQPQTDAGKEGQQVISSVLGAVPTALEGLADNTKTGEYLRNNYPGTFAALQAAGELAPFMLLAKGVHSGLPTSEVPTVSVMKPEEAYQSRKVDYLNSVRAEMDGEPLKYNEHVMRAAADNASSMAEEAGKTVDVVATPDMSGVASAVAEMVTSPILSKTEQAAKAVDRISEIEAALAKLNIDPATASPELLAEAGKLQALKERLQSGYENISNELGGEYEPLRTAEEATTATDTIQNSKGNYVENPEVVQGALDHLANTAPGDSLVYQSPSLLAHGNLVEDLLLSTDLKNRVAILDRADLGSGEGMLTGETADSANPRPNIFVAAEPQEQGWGKVLKDSGIFHPTTIDRLWRADATPNYAPVNGAEFRSGQHEKFKPAGTYWADDKQSLIPLIVGGYHKTNLRGAELKTAVVEATNHHLRTGENTFSVGRPLDRTRAVEVNRDQLKAFMLDNPKLPAMFTGTELAKQLVNSGIDFLRIKGVSGNPALSEIIQLRKGATKLRGSSVDFMSTGGSTDRSGATDLRSMAKRLDDTGNYGVVKRQADGSYIAVINRAAIEKGGGAKAARVLEATLHEAFGHVVVGERYEGASAETKLALENDFVRYSKLSKEEATKAFYPVKTGEIAIGVPEFDATSTHFKEWLVNGITKWATSEAEPVGLANKWFKKLADVFKKAFAKEGAAQTPESIRNWMNSMFDSSRLEDKASSPIETKQPIEPHPAPIAMSKAKQLAKLKTIVTKEDLAPYEIGKVEGQGPETLGVYRKGANGEKVLIDTFTSSSRTSARRAAELFSYAHALASRNMAEPISSSTARVEYYKRALAEFKPQLEQWAKDNGQSFEQTWLNFLGDAHSFLDQISSQDALLQLSEPGRKIFNRLKQAAEHNPEGLRKAILYEKRVVPVEVQELVKAEPILRVEIAEAPAPEVGKPIETVPAPEVKSRNIVRKRQAVGDAVAAQGSPVRQLAQAVDAEELTQDEASRVYQVLADKPHATVDQVMKEAKLEDAPVDTVQNSNSNFEDRVRAKAEETILALNKVGSKVNLERITSSVLEKLGLSGKDAKAAKEFIKANYEDLKAGKGKEVDLEVLKNIEDQKVPDDVSLEEALAYESGLEDMVVWHGSPHKFDEFKLDRIGSGEGAQVYGHGLYFAGNKSVAKWYKDKLSKGVDQVVINGGGEGHSNYVIFNDADISILDTEDMSVRRKKAGPITGPLHEKIIKVKNKAKDLSPDQISEKIKKRLAKEAEFVDQTSKLEAEAKKQNVSLTEYLRAVGKDKDGNPISEDTIAKILRKYQRLAKTIFTDTEHIIRLGRELGLVDGDTGVAGLEAYIKSVFPKAQGPLKQLTITGRDILMKRMQDAWFAKEGKAFDFRQFKSMRELQADQIAAMSQRTGWDKFKHGVTYFMNTSADELNTTPAGSALVQLIKNKITTENALYLRDYQKRLNELATRVTDPQDREHILDVYEGRATARNKTFQEGADLMREIYSFYGQEMENLGVRVQYKGGYSTDFKFDPAQSHYPHMWEPGSFDKPSEAMLNSLIVSGQAVDAKQARAIISQFGSRQTRLAAPRFANIEMAREVQMDGYIKDPIKVTSMYLNRGASRLAILREFGQATEQRLAQLAWDHFNQSGDPDQLNFAVKVINSVTGVSVHEPLMRRALNIVGVAEFTAMASALQHAAIIQPSIISNLAVTAGWKNTAKGFYRYIKADPRKASMSKEWADVLGASGRSVGKELMDQLGSNTNLQTRADKLLNFWKVTTVDRWLRDASSLVGQLHVNEMVERAINLNDPLAHRELKRLGLEAGKFKEALDAGKDNLVEDYIKKGSYAFSQRTNLLTDPLSKPLWQMEKTSWGGLLTLFGRFGFLQHHFLKGLIQDGRAVSGNAGGAARMAKYLAAATAVGVPIYTARQLAKGVNPVEDFAEKGLFGFMFGALQSGGGLGLFVDAAGNALNEIATGTQSTVNERFGGPVASLGKETATGVGKILHGDITNAQALRLLMRAGIVTIAAKAPEKFIPAAGALGLARPMIERALADKQQPNSLFK